MSVSMQPCKASFVVRREAGFIRRARENPDAELDSLLGIVRLRSIVLLGVDGRLLLVVLGFHGLLLDGILRRVLVVLLDMVLGCTWRHSVRLGATAAH